MSDKRKYLVKIGIGSLETPLTIKQAQRYGRTAMPDDLKRAGFVCSVMKATKEIHGGEWFRINYSK